MSSAPQPLLWLVEQKKWQGSYSCAEKDTSPRNHRHRNTARRPTSQRLNRPSTDCKNQSLLCSWGAMKAWEGRSHRSSDPQNNTRRCPRPQSRQRRRWQAQIAAFSNRHASENIWRKLKKKHETVDRNCVEARSKKQTEIFKTKTKKKKPFSPSCCLTITSCPSVWLKSKPYCRLQSKKAKKNICQLTNRSASSNITQRNIQKQQNNND